MSSKEELLKRLSDGVVEMEEDDVAEAAQEYLGTLRQAWKIRPYRQMQAFHLLWLPVSTFPQREPLFQTEMHR